MVVDTAYASCQGSLHKGRAESFSFGVGRMLHRRVLFVCAEAVLDTVRCQWLMEGLVATKR